MIFNPTVSGGKSETCTIIISGGWEGTIRYSDGTQIVTSDWNFAGDSIRVLKNSLLYYSGDNMTLPSGTGGLQIISSGFGWRLYAIYGDATLTATEI